MTRKTECRRWKSGGGSGVMLQQDGGWKGRGESAASGISFREDRGVTRRKTYQLIGIHMRQNIWLASVRPDMAQPRVSERRMSAKTCCHCRALELIIRRLT